MEGWDEDQRRMDARVRRNTCGFGDSCRSALNCPYWHSVEELQIFADERELAVRKLRTRCGFCVRGECRNGGDCPRGDGCGWPAPRGRTVVDSEYESATSYDGDDDGVDSGYNGVDAVHAVGIDGDGRCQVEEETSEGPLSTPPRPRPPSWLPLRGSTAN